MACGGHKVNAMLAILKKYWVQMQGGDCPAAESVILDLQIILLLLPSPPTFPIIAASPAL